MLKLPIRTRLFYIGLWQFADDYGHLEDDPDQLQVLIFPGGCEPVSAEEVNKMLAELLQCHRLVRYEANGKKCLSISFWDRWQHIKKPSRPRLPSPTSSPLVPHSSPTSAPELGNKGIRELGKENKGIMGVPPHSLEGWIERVKTASKPVSELGEMILLLSEGKEKFDYGRLGAIAKKHSPAYIAKLIWNCASARPADWLDYIQGILRHEKKEEPMGELKEY